MGHPVYEFSMRDTIDGTPSMYFNQLSLQFGYINSPLYI
jgi:hypothetical protein